MASEKKLIIVNDGSKDGTVQAIERYMAANPAMGIHFHQQPHNMGKRAQRSTRASNWQVLN